MRGKGFSVQVQDAPYRITPAYAGKRLEKCQNVKLQKDHPRLCGEKIYEALHLTA